MKFLLDRPPPDLNGHPTKPSLSDRNAHLNEFDKELADLDLAEIESQEATGLCFGGSEESQAENISNIQREELHDVHESK